ncbi:hypothetical protein [Planctobacterium marinum]|uniref:hypothetical protein n=1 Tax=Planctobacterium marinum TaxID=1631968 RepID=UPI001E501893|nr:hypothetical protein [Planctobacterium marinum]MCC2607505.1 hypothetical protein [Planctobacterium marinum]
MADLSGDKSLIHMKGQIHGAVYQVVVLLIALILALTGIWLSHLQWLGYEWFSRAGSLIVVLGVASGFGGIFQEQLLRSRLLVQERIALAKTRRKLRLMQAPPEFADEEINRVIKQYDDLEESLQTSIKVQAGTLEFFLLVVGTLIWGFGDIAIALL